MTKEQPKRIVFLGPPGSGKGTQAALLARASRIPHISTGDIFRDHIARRTAIGKKVSRLLRRGTLVPDRLTNLIVRRRLAARDCRKGFVLDGYPRTRAQALFLERHYPTSLVLLLMLPDREIVSRVGGRRIAPDGTVYHLTHNPPPAALRRTLVQRDDEKPATVRRRLRTYRALTGPLIGWYARKGLIAEVDGRPSIGRVATSVSSTVRDWFKGSRT